MREEEIKSLAKAIAADLPFFALARLDATSMKAGDVLVVRSQDLLTADSMVRIMNSLAPLLPEGVHVAVLDGGLDIDVLESK